MIAQIIKSSIGSKLKYHVGDMFRYIFQTFLVTKCITFWNMEL
jgi:hypothetical protein